MELCDVNKIGKKTEEKLNNLGIYTIDDLIRNYPYRFECLVRRSIDDSRYFDNMTIDGMIVSNPVVSFFKKNMNKMSFRVNVGDKIINAVIFNRAFMKNNIKIGSYVTLIGKYDSKKETIILNNLYLSKLPDKPVYIPIYHLTKGVTSSNMKTYINSALSYVHVPNNIPNVLKEKYKFIDEDEALRIINNPDSEENLKIALKTLKYEELYTYFSKLKKLKEESKKRKEEYSKKIDKEKINEFINKLPFKLTGDQLKVIDEMIDDLKSDALMNRLLQGDVGSGKTIVSFVLAYALFTSNFQSVMMAPTEILAEQHYNNALNIFKDTNLKVGLLTGKTKKKDQKKIYEDVLNGDIDFLIGTHSLINDNLIWNNLGLIITDEQHRFGVNQRIKLKNKSNYPEVLMMSATPIPRTYALTLYADTDVSTIKEKPKGRMPVITSVKKTSELKDVLKEVYRSIQNKNQIYVIAPMIEEDEESNRNNVNDLKHKFKLAFKDAKIEILHGKMDTLEKDKVMEDFSKGKIDILISTTVVEVGVDVANANVMVIFDADKFGLSTLHQLRGRVGRGKIQSYCFLICDSDKERLKIIEETDDGFKIAEEDFKLRGGGDLFGFRQSGILSFKLSDVKRDYDMFVKVKKDVDEMSKI